MATPLNAGVEQRLELERIRQRLSNLPDPVATLEGIFAFSPLGLQIFKASGESLLVNRAFRAIFGSEPPPGYNVLRDEIAEQRGVLSIIQRAFKGETVNMPPIWYDPRELTQVDVKEGRRVAVGATFFPLFDRSGAVAFVGVAFKDVTAELTCQEQASREQDLLREENTLIDRLRRIGSTLTAELDLDKLVQQIIDETAALVRASFGAFFYNVVGEDGEAYTLFALSGAPPEAFSHLPLPRKTALFGPTFSGKRVVRLDDVAESPHFGKEPPFFGMPPGHLPVKSYLAAPVISRSGDVLGGLFFGHPDRGVFTERDERLVVGVAAQAAVAVDNARLYNETRVAAKKLRDSEQYYRLVTEAIPPIVWTADKDGGVDFCNQRWLDFAGLTMEQSKGWGWVSALHPDDVDRTSVRWKESLRSGDIYQIEQRLKQIADGSYRWFLCRALPVRDESGNIVKWFGTCTDIQDQKRIEKEREELLRRERAARAEAESAEHRFKFLSEASAALSSSLEPDKTLSALVGLAVPELADCGLVTVQKADGGFRNMAAACVKPAQLEILRELDRRFPLDGGSPHGYPRVLASGEPDFIGEVSDATLSSLAKNEEHLRLLRSLDLSALLCVPIHVQGRVVAALTLMAAGSSRRFGPADRATTEDLARRAGLALENATLHKAEQTARWEAERAASRVFRLQAVTSALAEALTRSQVAEVAVQQGVAALGGRQGVLYVLSSEGERLVMLEQMGLSPEAAGQLMELPLSAPAPPCQAARTSEPVWLEIEEPWGAPGAGEPGIGLLLGAKALACVPLVLEGRTAGVMMLCFDEPRGFTEDDRFLLLTLARQCAQALDRARLYEAERKARREAQAANRAKDEFLSVVSHEIRTPLNAMLGWAQILAGKLAEPEALHKGLGVIIRNAKAQTRIIEDILDVSRIITGKLRLELRPVEVAQVVRAAVEVVRPAAEARHIDVELSLGEGLVVSGDPDRLQQVVWNLLSNAIKFTPREGRVQVTVRPVGGSVEIAVTDSGRGISPEFLPFVFDRFRQADSSMSRGHGGLGLGLAIVRYLVEMHGGTVEAESAGEGQGATFRVALPVRDQKERVSEPGSRRAPQRPAVPSPLASVAGLKVLVVDDELDARELLTALLEANGAIVEAAASASDAMAAVDRFEPDVVLSDIGMPGEDGLSFMKRLRALGSTVPAVALSAYASADDSKKALLAGFQAHLAKPVDIGALTNAITGLARSASGSDK
ncbi:MAG TPA: GAF domain-containing protein [Polyangiaceae bacterium]|nr:GAF domain-containing protein [Polyangiaceae bacterium]